MRQKDMSGIFRDLAAGRREERMRRMTHGVYCQKQRGGLYKEPTDRCENEAAAEKRAAELMRLNPGSTYVVKPL